MEWSGFTAVLVVMVWLDLKQEMDVSGRYLPICCNAVTQFST
jgi:hypothetical protein